MTSFDKRMQAYCAKVARKVATLKGHQIFVPCLQHMVTLPDPQLEVNYYEDGYITFSCASCNSTHSGAVDKVVIPDPDRTEAIRTVTERVKFWGDYIKRNRLRNTDVCPSCGYPFVNGQSYDICQLCNWEDDGADPDAFTGGPNRITLNESRIEIYRKLKDRAATYRLHWVGPDGISFKGDIPFEKTAKFPFEKAVPYILEYEHPRRNNKPIVELILHSH